MKRLSGAETLFIIGPPRSGTTLLARLLNAHGSILMTNETAVFLFFCESIRRSKRGVRAGILWGKDYHELWSEHLSRAARPMIEAFYEDIARREGREGLRYWGEKHPHHDVCMDFLLDLYPESRFIYTLRDPRDSICSICEMNRWPFARGLDVWLKMSTRYGATLEELDPTRLYHIRYEEIVEDSEREMGRLLAWLGLEMDRGLREAVQRYRTRDAHDRLKTPLDFKTRSVGRWRRELGPEELQLVDRELQGFLELHGYASAGR